MSDRLVFLDTEGTGLARQDRIIEIGIVEVIGDRLTGRRLNTLVYTDEPIHFGAQRVHGIKAKDLIGKPAFSQIAEDVLDFIGDSPAFAHNAAYDGRMLAKEWDDINLPDERRPRLMCTLPIARNVVGNKTPNGKVGIDALLAHYFPHEPPRGKHSAADDAEILARIFLRMRDDEPAIVARLLASWDKNNFVPPQKAPTPRRPTAYDAGLPEELNPGVAEAIAEANAAGTLDAAMKIRIGRDYVTRMSVDNVCARAGRANVVLANTLSQPSETLAALRMMVRGLEPQLAVERQMEFTKRRQAQVEMNAQQRDQLSAAGFSY